MSLKARLIQVEMYLPNVLSSADLQKAVGPLKKFCRNQHNIALAVEPFNENERGGLSLIVAGTDKVSVEQESEHLLEWLESNISGQSLATNVAWL